MIPISTFKSMADGVKMAPRVRAATYAVLVRGETWATAARRHRVTQSGISKAIKRMKHKGEHCALCGQKMPAGIQEA